MANGKPGRPSNKTLREEIVPKIEARIEFKAGNMTGKWVKGVYVVLSYTTEIGQYTPAPDFDQNKGGWKMFIIDEPTFTTRGHISLLQRAINNKLWQA